MREIGGFSFPENKEEADCWKHSVQYSALASRVLCAAHTRIEGTWCAYCDAVPGASHNSEYAAVLHYGDKLPETIAKVIFPRFSDVPYAR